MGHGTRVTRLGTMTYGTEVPAGLNDMAPTWHLAAMDPGTKLGAMDLGSELPHLNAPV